MTDETVKKQGRSKTFWVTIGAVATVGIVGIGALLAWPGVIQPALEENDRLNSVSIRDGEATDSADVAPDIKAKQKTVDDFNTMIKTTFDEYGSGVESGNDYSPTSCSEDVDLDTDGKDCISGASILYKDYYFGSGGAEINDVYDAVTSATVNYFREEGYKIVAYAPGFDYLERKAIETGGSSDDLATGEADTADLNDSFRKDVEKNGFNSEHVTHFSSLVLCLDNTTLFEEISGLKGYSAEEACSATQVDLTSYIEKDTEPERVTLSFSTSLGYKWVYQPEEVPQVEGRNYTIGEMENISSIEGVDTCENVTPSLVHAHWEKWGDEVRCAFK